MEVYDILLEAHQHLRRRLSADTPVHIRLTREKDSRCRRTSPGIGDRISEKDHSLLVAFYGGECFILRVVACQVWPVVKLCLHPLALLHPRRSHAQQGPSYP